MKTTLFASGARSPMPRHQFFRRIFPALSLLSLLTIARAGPVAPVAPAEAPQPANESVEAGWRYVTRLTTLISYDDNIFIRPHNRQGDFSLHLAPSVAWGTGNFRSEFAPFAPIPHLLARTGEEELPQRTFAFVSYTPDGVLFAQHSKEDALNHDFRIIGRREREQWSAQGQFRFQSVADADVEAGRRLRQNYFTAEGGADYSFTAKTTGRVALHGEHTDYAGGLASTDSRATAFVDYQLAPKTALGIGGAVGYLDVANGANQTYAQPLGQIRYRATGKLAFTGQAGEEFRHYDSSVGQRTRFVFAVNGDYTASEDTKLTLSTRRETHSSAQYAGENIVATSYQGGLRQRWLRRNYLSLFGGVVHNDYEGNQPGALLDRRDDYYYGRVSSARDVTERGTIELGYEHRANVSSASNLGFDENIFTVAASILF